MLVRFPLERGTRRLSSTGYSDEIDEKLRAMNLVFPSRKKRKWQVKFSSRGANPIQIHPAQVEATKRDSASKVKMSASRRLDRYSIYLEFRRFSCDTGIGSHTSFDSL